MKQIRSILFVIYLMYLNPLMGATTDSLSFINAARKFAFHTLDYTPENPFYASWSQENKPYLYVYISYADTLKQPKEYTSSYLYFGTDTSVAFAEENKLHALGYQTFCYHTFANSAALLNQHLLRYTKEAIAFIVFHELTHRYIGSKKLNIPYLFNEALCDVIGNAGAQEFSKATQLLDTVSVLNQTRLNESIYESMNEAIANIKANPHLAGSIHTKCSIKIHELLQEGNTFQKDRFDYPINNAYLIKNQNYCCYYFLLKQVLIKQQSIRDLLKIIERMPANEEACQLYLQQFR